MFRDLGGNGIEVAAQGHECGEVAVQAVAEDARDHVQVGVEDALTRLGAVVQKQIDGIALQGAAPYRRADALPGIEHRGAVFRVEIREIGSVTTRDNERVARVDRHHVEEGDDTIVLEDDAPGFTALDDATEGTAQARAFDAYASIAWAEILRVSVSESMKPPSDIGTFQLMPQSLRLIWPCRPKPILRLLLMGSDTGPACSPVS
jgi:hypothetical protein